MQKQTDRNHKKHEPLTSQEQFKPFKLEGKTQDRIIKKKKKISLQVQRAYRQKMMYENYILTFNFLFNHSHLQNLITQSPTLP